MDAIFEAHQATHPTGGRLPWFQVRRIPRDAPRASEGTLELDFIPSPGIAAALANNLQRASMGPASPAPAAVWHPRRILQATR